MDLWVLFLALAAIFALIGWYRMKATHKAALSPPHRRDVSLSTRNGGQPMPINNNLPAAWDERSISAQLMTMQAQPQILTTYISALKQRFILNVEDRTAQVRTRFLRTHIEQLELGKQYATLSHDLRAMESEQENRLLRLALEKRELEAKAQQAETLDGLRLQKERLTLEVEIADLKTKKKTIQKPSVSEPKLTPDQQRRLKRLEIEDKLRELDHLEEQAIQNARSEGERVRIQNMYVDKRDELHEQLSKYLI
jgi:hypothetical protein